MEPKVCIIILNWNGWKDTVECLESLQQSAYSNYYLVVVDNGSTNNDLAFFQQWAEGHLPVNSQYVSSKVASKPVYVAYYDRATAEGGGAPGTEAQLSACESAQRMIIIQCGENLGFARGNNVGIRYALATQAHYILILNNDTVVASDALSQFVAFMEDNPTIQISTGQIRLYDHPDTLWNCGGKLTWYGMRTYFNAGEPIATIPADGHRIISFVTGCAALCRTTLLREIGLFSEQFFFGEEDFELAQRMKRHDYKMACLYSAVIYHKVSTSINAKTNNQLGKIYVHYLNRFIDMRSFMSYWVWQFWRYLYLPYIVVLLKRNYNYPIAVLIRFSVALLQDSVRLDGVDKATFEASLHRKF